MGPLLVVLLQPVLHDLSGIALVAENIEVQHLMAKCAVESFDIRVLCWLARLDELHIHSSFFGPICQGHGHEFRSISNSQLRGTASQSNHSVQHPNDSRSRQCGIHLVDGERLAIEVVENVERMEALATHQDITHEVHRPA